MSDSLYRARSAQFRASPADPALARAAHLSFVSARLCDGPLTTSAKTVTLLHAQMVSAVHHVACAPAMLSVYERPSADPIDRTRGLMT